MVIEKEGGILKIDKDELSPILLEKFIFFFRWKKPYCDWQSNSLVCWTKWTEKSERCVNTGSEKKGG